MSCAASILIALFTGIAGALCAGFVAAAYANWYRVSNVVVLLSPTPVELLRSVADYGNGLVARLREIVATPVEQDPGNHLAADFSLRFSAGRAAAHHLRAAGGDFAPQLQAILELSRLREDSLVLTSDVRRVASDWLLQWNGTPAQPDDPPPR